MGQNLEDIRFDGELFLEDVLEKLHKKMDELKEDLTAGEQEIRQMHDYYWENYTEMDQYGYEDYDNQQALLHQVNANQEKLRMQQRIARLMDAPFFGRVDFIYDGEDESEPFYIGIGNFAPEAGMCPLIYDWRRSADFSMIMMPEKLPMRRHPVRSQERLHPSGSIRSVREK